jgi:cytochrome c oxidase subunit 3/cytochrome o ubiquinol oxidase subunit 3
LTITWAVASLRRGAVAAFGALWLVTILLGAEFLIGTGIEWRGLIYEKGLTIRTNLLGTTFYSLVGFHALHVTVGLLMLSAVLVFTVLGRVREPEAERVDVLSWYWHFVDAVWVVVLTVVYLVGT